MALGLSGSGNSSNSWEPSVKYLLVLLLAEIFVFGLMRSLMNHGG